MLEIQIKPIDPDVSIPNKISNWLPEIHLNSPSIHSHLLEISHLVFVVYELNAKSSGNVSEVVDIWFNGSMQNEGIDGSEVVGDRDDGRNVVGLLDDVDIGFGVEFIIHLILKLLNANYIIITI